MIVSTHTSNQIFAKSWRI